MSLEIANEDYAITITPNGAWTPGHPNYIIFKATKLKVNAKFALIWHIIWDIKDCILAGYTPLGGSGIIMPTGTKCFTNSDNPLRRTDSGQCSGSFQSIADGSILVCNCGYEITNAGQVKAKCN
jgi:hypothetical protein